MTVPDIVKMQRELLRMSRKEISVLLGYKSSTVKRYELKRCSLVYYEKIKNLINLYNMGFIQFQPTRADYDSRSLPAYYLTADETILSKFYLKGDEYDVYLHNYDRLITLIKAGKLTSKKP
jgi:transcriptional regulator with XRE-family HTH domain